jgi:ABC-type transport system involved in multi-copper enzyme maturation permease subunit
MLSGGKRRSERRTKLIQALIKKDSRLLRVYLRSAAMTSIVCYLFMGVLVVILTTYQDPGMQTIAARTLYILASGSNFGFVATSFFAALLGGSVFTLERSDRSSEFLACLPPTRMQNLISKLTVVLGSIGAMIVVHVLTNIAAHQIVPFVPANVSMIAKDSLSSTLVLVTMIAVTVSMVGGSFAVSASVKSNGVPVLGGLLTPLLVLSLVSLIGWALDIPSEGNAFAIRYATSAFVLGILFAYIGCFWYLTRSEP